MNTLRRFPGWRHWLLFFVVTVLFFLLGYQAPLSRPTKRLIEVVLAVFLVLGFVTHPVIARNRRAAGRLAGATALLCPLLLLLIDAANPRHLSLYPLTSWHMFSGPVGKLPEPTQFRYVAHFFDGGSTRLIPGGAISDVVTSSLDGELRTLLHKMEMGREADEQRAAEALRAVARLAEGADPERAIWAITVERCQMPVNPPFEPDCKPLRQVRVR